MTGVLKDGPQQLQREGGLRQDCLLMGVAEAARKLLTIADFDTAVNGALEAIATAAEIDRIFVYRNHVELLTQREFATCPYEWTAEGIVKCSEILDQFPMFYGEIEGYSDWLAELKVGKPVQKLARDMSEAGQIKQIQEQALSVLTVPIFISGNYWGNFGFDDCTTERVWSEAEIAVLETAAASFAGALERRDNLAELQRQDALLNSVNKAAQCLVAVDELEYAIPQALRILGEGTEQDRVYVFENVFPKGPEEVFWDIPYEWTAAGIPLGSEIVVEALPIAMASFPTDFVNPFWDGQAIQFLTRDLDGVAKDINDDMRALSMLAVPIAVSGQWWGVLGFDDCTFERKWSDAEIAVLETAAACIGSAIERDRTRKEREAVAQARAEELFQVNSILQTSLTSLASQTDLNAFLGHVTHLINQAAGAYSGYVFLQDTPTNTLELRLSVQKGQIRIGASATDPELFQHPFPADITPAYPGLCKTREIGLYGGYLDIDSDLMWPGTTEWHRRSGHKEAAAVALYAGDQPIGMLGLTFDHEVDLRDEDRDLIRALADQAALAIQLANLAEETKQTALLQEREQAAQARGAELAKVNHVLKETIDTLVAEPELSRFLGLVLKAIAQQFNSPFLEFWSNWRTDEENITYLEQVVINGEVLTGEQLSGHHGINGLSVPREVMKADDLAQRTQFIEIDISPTNPFIEPLYDNIYSWCRDRNVDLPGHAINFPIILGQQSLGAIAIFLPKERELSEETIKLGYALANQVALAMQLTQLAEETKQTALLQERETIAKAQIADLAERDRILEATAAAANVMLTDENFDSAISTALAIVGHGLEVDRILLGQHIDASSTEEPIYIQFLNEWVSAGTTSQIEHPELVKVSDEGIEFIYESLRQGQIFGGIIDELPEPFRSGQIELGVKSTYSIPIMVEGDYWGVIAFDDCHQLTRRSEAELEALKTLANCIGSAIARDRTRKEREAAAQAYAAELETHNLELANRDRILEATAAAANVLLTDKDFEGEIKQALQLIGEAVGTDRVGIAQHLEDLTETNPGHWLVIHEWSIPEMTPVADLCYPDPMQGTYGGAEQLYAIHQRGESFSIKTEQMMEPFRSSMAFMNIQTLHAVPIILREQYWGTVVFGDCRQQRQRSLAELTALQTVADCIGNAIDRDRIRKAREAAERTALIERERAARAAELEAANQVLTTRDRWLETTATAANQLLAADISTSVNTALQTIGTNLESDRLGVMRHIPDATELGHFQILYEWDAADTAAQINDLELHQMPASDFAEWTWHLMTGQPVGGPVEKQPEPFRSKMRSLGTLSTYAVPIFIETEFWGVMFMDYCRELRQLTSAELAVFKTVATCIGSAIYREQMRCDREQAERDTLLQQEREQAAQKRAAALEIYNRQLQQRDTLLNSVNAAAQSLVANEDLATALPTMLKILGEGTGQCRAYILRNSLDEQTSQLLFNLMLEWDAPQIPPKMEVGAHFPVPIDRFPDHLTAPLKAGRATQFLASELDGIKPEDRQPGQVLSLVGVPITVGGEWWGLLGLDDCVEERVWSDAEIAVLETAASAVGGAVERDHTRQAREAAEKEVLAEREKAARERAAELAKTNEAIARSLTSLVASPELDQFLGAIIAEMARQLNACKVHLFLYDKPTHTLVQRVAVQDGDIYLGAGPHDPKMFNHPIPADITPGWNAIINGERPLTYDETQPYDEELWWPETLVWHKAQGHMAVTAIPMKAGNVPIGFIGFCFHNRTVLNDEQLEFMQALANQAIVAIQLTHLADEAKQTAILQEQEKAAQERASQLTRSNQALKSSLDSLAQQPELDAFLQRVVNEATEQTGAANGHLFLYDELANAYWLHIATENNGDWRSVPDMELWLHSLPLDGAPEFWELILKKKPFFVENLHESLVSGPHIWEPSIAWHLRRNHSSFICSPLVLGDRVLGFLGLPFIGTTSFSYEDVELAQALANQATMAIQLTRLADEAKQTAILQEQEKAARERATELAKTNEAISQTLDALTTEPELERFLGQILTQIIEQIGADDTHLFLYDAETHTLRSQLAVQNNVVYVGNAPGDPELFYTDIPADITAGWTILVDANRPLTLDENNPETAEFYWPTIVEWHSSRGHKSVTCVCMKIGNQPIGFIGFAFCDQTVLSTEQLEFVQALTNQATLAIHLTRLAEQARTNALTDERNRLAREIHDTLAQAFTGISLQLEAAKNILVQQPETAKSYLDQARDLTRQGLSEARRSVRALRSQALESETLVKALQKNLTQMTLNTSLQTEFQIQGTPILLEEGLQLNLLRIGQEAITNVLRHAQAKNLIVILTFTDQEVSLCVTDDGLGFEPQDLADITGFGLVGIRERTARYHGQVKITSHPGEGTTIEVKMPVQLNASSPGREEDG